MPHPAERDRPLTDVPLPEIDAMSPLMARAAVVALEALAEGVREEPPRSNRGPVVDRYLLGHDGKGGWLLTAKGAAKGAPWCARACVWWVEEAALQLGLPSAFGVDAHRGGLASAYKLRGWARTRARWKADPRPGRLGVLLDEDTLQGHVVLVLRVGSEVVSVEGNSGDRVRCVARQAGRFAGFVELD